MAATTRTIGNEDAMAALAARLGAVLRRGDVVTLRGTLGAGKTTFARALIRSLAGAAEEVPSPTFTLVQTYDLPELSLWHFDLYRLEERENDILELGWEEARRQGAVLVEWPERLGTLLPRDHLDIAIDFTEDSETSRRVTLTPHGGWISRMESLA